MSNVLSQSEMESLLWSLDLRTANSSENGEPIEADTAIADLSGSRRRTTPIVLDALRTIHKAFARDLAASLGGLLRLPVGMKLTTVDPLPLGEYVSTIGDPTFVCVIETAPLRERWLLELTAPIALPIVDRLLGGSGTSSPAIGRRPLTDIETKLLSRVPDLAIAALRSAWGGICDLAPRVAEAGGRSRLAPFASQESAIVCLAFELCVGEVVGAVNLCLPVAAADRLSAALSGRSSSPADDSAAANDEEVRDFADGASPAARVVVRLATARLTADEVANLAVGDVIVTDGSPQQPLTVFVDGQPRFAGSPGLAAGRKAVRIGAPVAPAKGVTISSGDSPAAP